MILLDEKIYKSLFEDYYEPLCNIAYRYLKDTDATEDVVQEVFTYLWRKRKELSIKSNIKSYLFSSVKNKCIEKIRRGKIESKFISEALANESYEEEYNPDIELEKLALAQKLYASIDELPKKCSLIFKMAKLEGLTYNEISEELDLSVKTIESQMRRAFILLREKLS